MVQRRAVNLTEPLSPTMTLLGEPPFVTERLPSQEIQDPWFTVVVLVEVPRDGKVSIPVRLVASLTPACFFASHCWMACRPELPVLANAHGADSCWATVPAAYAAAFGETSGSR